MKSSTRGIPEALREKWVFPTFFDKAVFGFWYFLSVGIFIGLAISFRVWQQDLPEWIYSGIIFWKIIFSNHDAFFPFEIINYPVPNATFQVVFGFLGYYFGYHAANLFYIFLILACLPFIITYCLSRINQNEFLPRAIVLMTTVFLGFPFWQGNANFLLACSLFCFICSDPNLMRRPIQLFFLLTVLFFTHAIPFAVCWLFFLTQILYRYYNGEDSHDSGYDYKIKLLFSLGASAVPAIWYIGVTAYGILEGSLSNMGFLVAELENQKPFIIRKIIVLFNVGNFVDIRGHDFSSLFSIGLKAFVLLAQAAFIWTIFMFSFLGGWHNKCAKYIAISLLIIGIIAPENALGVFHFSYRILLLAWILCLIFASLPSKILRIGSILQLFVSALYFVWAFNQINVIPAPNISYDDVSALTEIRAKERDSLLGNVPRMIATPYMRYTFYVALDEGRFIPMTDVFNTGIIRNIPKSN